MQLIEAPPSLDGSFMNPPPFNNHTHLRPQFTSTPIIAAPQGDEPASPHEAPRKPNPLPPFKDDNDLILPALDSTPLLSFRSALQDIQVPTGPIQLIIEPAALDSGIEIRAAQPNGIAINQSLADPAQVDALFGDIKYVDAPSSPKNTKTHIVPPTDREEEKHPQHGAFFDSDTICPEYIHTCKNCRLPMTKEGGCARVQCPCGQYICWREGCFKQYAFELEYVLHARTVHRDVLNAAVTTTELEKQIETYKRSERAADAERPIEERLLNALQYLPGSLTPRVFTMLTDQDSPIDLGPLMASKAALQQAVQECIECLTAHSPTRNLEYDRYIMEAIRMGIYAPTPNDDPMFRDMAELQLRKRKGAKKTKRNLPPPSPVVRDAAYFDADKDLTMDPGPLA